MATPRWFLDEYAHAGDEHLDADYVLNYNRKTGTNRADDVAVLRDLGLNETHTLVDLGAGTGALALAAAPVCRRVVAVDVSPAMVDFLRQTVEQEGISNIECVQGGFLSYEHQGDPADFLYSRNALHHLPDFWKAIALERMAAILKPGGILYLRDLTFSFELPETEQRIEAWLDAAPKQAEMGWTRPELETHLREEYSTFSWLLEPMIDRAGFDIRHAEHSGSKIYAAYTCIRR
ncbi:MAG TPA: class I SAM-dependent methyltransferase [Ktedonobacterales bacterium]|nr:class I SAM-dependent methyltransferase [Ktedonobacterales bacterium]